MSDLREHWDRTYSTKAETAVSWYRPQLDLSFQLIRKAGPAWSSSIVDIGGGASTLPDTLLNAGYNDVTVVDISSTALAKSQSRLGNRASEITWEVADITQWSPVRTWDVWHDRAVFHFLTDVSAQENYIRALRAGTRSGSGIVMATFAPDGPEKCSGLPVQRYSAAALAERFGHPFILHEESSDRHATPFGTVQNFTYALFIRS